MPPYQPESLRPKIDTIIVTHGRFKTGRALDLAVLALTSEIQSAGPNTKIGLMLPPDVKEAVRDAVKKEFPDVKGDDERVLTPIMSHTYSDIEKEDVRQNFATALDMHLSVIREQVVAAVYSTA